VENPDLLKQAKLALTILRGVFASEISYEKVIIFADIIKNQSIEMGVGWKTLLKQYADLSAEIYNDNPDFFKLVQRYVANVT
jgi:hypothetical protein